MNDILIAVPNTYIGKELRPAGWCKDRVIAGFVPEDLVDLQAFARSLRSWNDEPRSIVKVLVPERFTRRLTGPDHDYHGIWATERPLSAAEYEVLGPVEEVLI